jgi:hypothetical protein
VRRPLPFDGFLDLLRQKGYAVGLPQHFALGRLLARWDRTDAGAFGDALAALVGRSHEEVAAIRRLYDEVYGEPEPLPPPPPPPPVLPWWREHVRTLAIGALAVVVVATLTSRILIPEPVEPTPPSLPVPPVDDRPLPPPPGPDEPGRVAEQAPPTPPDLPEPPSIVAARLLMLIGGAGFAAGLGWAWWAKLRAVTRRWLRSAWSGALGALPGPYQLTLRVPDAASRLGRTDVEDAAVLLGRIFSADARTRELDVLRSLRLTVSRGMAPHLVFRRARRAHAILVLQDVGFDMQPWGAKVDALLSDLRRQGIAFERWFFDGDIRRLSQKPHGAWVWMDTVVARRSEAPLLVLSTGGGLAALEESSSAWWRPLERFVRGVWVTPVADSRLWPAAFGHLPMNVWPMTRAGLTHAAHELAGIEVAEPVRLQALEEVRVTRDDVERVKRLASLLPHPTIEMLESLRQQVAPDVSDAVLAHIARDAGIEGHSLLRMPADEVARRAAAVRAETPRLEAAARRQILSVLDDSRPPEGSAAFLRWQMAVAMQQVSLAELRQEPADEALATLRRLGEGPLWEEVRETARMVPGSPGTALTDLGRTESPPPDPGDLARWERRPMSLPGVRELVLASLVALAVPAVARLSGRLPSELLPHVPDAYELSQPDPDVLALTVRQSDPSQPATVRLFRDGAALDDPVAIAPGGSVTIPIEDGAGHYYQVRTPLSGGNLALSDPLWVPDPNRTVVVVDARPWARFTIEGTTNDGDPVRVDEEYTPMRVALQPGTYTVTFTNDVLGSSTSRELIVTADPGNEPVAVTMPGFDADATATRLLEP